eukprot:CAMPEP_0170244134 /NCGR_PEP_ID=MMETSP0116_2-20130129/21845_1 /TAXON_ID=400756 /ORGANISM="Durinskia baltica, Strain CSIRO CS-38" /LENGTH=57 /DNA_ID=CAMNT_0010494993 /DNA_START=106 /DNA_END=276 /DNA_ORIENTATION=+
MPASVEGYGAHSTSSAAGVCDIRRSHFLEDSVRESQSRPSYSPSPVVAHADWMNHCR